MAKRQFERPQPGSNYTAEQRAEWGRQQDLAHLEREVLKPTPKPRQSRAKPVVFDGDSTCFSDLQYSKSDGGVYATFANKTVGTWFVPMSAAEARKWANSESYGQYFNDNFYGA